MESKKHNKLVTVTNKQTHRYREQTSGYQGERAGQGQDRSGRVRGTVFPCGAGVKNPPANAGNVGLTPGSGRPLE